MEEPPGKESKGPRWEPAWATEDIQARAAEQSEQERQEIQREGRERGDHRDFVGLRALFCFQVLLEEMTWGEEIK